MKRISEYASDVEVALKGLGLGERKPRGLYAPIEYAMTAGGKRLRPVLTLMSAEVFGGSLEAAMPAALGLEMYHNFTLLHDDVMDKSDTRRGRQTVHIRYGEDAAILSGDTMLTLATQLMMQVEESKLRSVLDIFNRMAVEVYEGQAYDMEFERRDEVSVEEYIEMVRLKTGALLGACAEIGALIGGVDGSQAEAMHRYGEMLGIAFQIEDDRLDTFGDASTFGKLIGGDIRNGKKTYLLTAALSRGDEDSKALRAAIQLPPSDLRVRTVTKIYEKMGMKEEIRKAVAHYSAEALSALRGSGLDEEGVLPFKALLDRLTGRRK